MKYLLRRPSAGDFLRCGHPSFLGNTPYHIQSSRQATLVVYQHGYLDDSPLALPTGKIVSIGRNYLDHILDLTLRDLPQFVKEIAWLSPPWRIDAVSGKG